MGLLLSLLFLILLGNKLILPNRLPVGSPPEDLPIEVISFSSSAGVPLKGWLIPHPKAEMGVLLMHGSNQNRAIMVPRARFLHQAGFSVFLFDFRAHGESGGHFKTFGLGEHEDAKAALKVLKERTGVTKTAVIGFSLGAAASVLGPHPLDVDAYVLEALFPTIEAAVANRIELYLGPFASWTHPLLSRQIPLRTGIPLKSLRPMDVIGSIRAPIFLIAGAEDRRATPEEARRLFETIRDPRKQFWLVTQASHTNYHAAQPAAYERKILQFLAESCHETENRD